jgi:hypothetical protein
MIENLNTSGDSRSIKINSNWNLELSCLNELMLSNFSTSLFKVINIIGTGDGGNYFVENNLPIATFYFTNLNNDVRIFLPNFVTGSSFLKNGINLYVRTGNGKTARVYGSNSSVIDRIYDVGGSNSNPKTFITIPANQNAHFIYANNYWWLFD